MTDDSALRQPAGSIFQFAYVTPNAHLTALQWTAQLGIGPWLVRGPFSAPTARYLGESSEASFTVARTYSGGVMIELIQQHDEHPSVFREAAATGAVVFHHTAVATEDFEGLTARLRSSSGAPVFEDVLPTTARVAFFDTAKAMGGLTEVVELVEAQRAFYVTLERLCAGWDGTEPWRLA